MTSIAVVAKNDLLDGLGITHFSAHTAFPGSTGANELSGGSPAYARKAGVVNVASGGQRALNVSVAFDVYPCTLRWLGALDSGTFLFALPNGGATPKNFVYAPTDYAAKIICAAHGYSDTQKVVFFQGTPPGGLTEGTTYFVRDATTDTFKVAATSGGAAITLTSALASYGSVVCAITEDVVTVQGTHTLSAFTVCFPD
jgi:hypothetical protein